MSAAAEGRPDGHEKHAAPSSVRRSAFYLQSRAQPLFAWLHDRPSSLSHGIVLCPPLGFEQVHAHRSLRVLADRLSDAGFPVIRFDYHGTGDSAGGDEDPDRLQTWCANIRDAIAWMQTALGCTHISLAGLRFGATLATLVSSELEVENLFLWEPIVNGRRYVRELKALSLTATIRGPSDPRAPEDIEAAGFVFTKSTANDLSRVDLLSSNPRCRRALIVTRDDLPGDSKLLDHFRAIGLEVQSVAQPGYADLMAEPHFTRVPHQAIACAVEWFRAGAKGDRTIERRFDSISMPTEAVVQTGMREQAVLVPREPGCERADLIGVLTESMQDRPVPLPTILLLNAGAAYRVGANRLYVPLARELAGHGFSVLRLDLGGLGDSVPPGLDGENDTYASGAFRDIEAVLKYLETTCDMRRIVLMGLCSGAYFAFQSGVQMDDPAIVESVLINPLTFFWKDGMTLETSSAREHHVFDYYWRSAMKPANWLKLFSGQTKIGIGGAIRMFLHRWRSRGGSATDAAASESPSAVVGHPLREDLSADLERIARRGRPLTCFFASADPGWGLMTFQARHKVDELRASGALSVTILDDADHTFSFRVPRAKLMAAIREGLEKRYLNPSASAH